MGILPLQYVEGHNADSLGLTGQETFDIPVTDGIRPKQLIEVRASSGVTFVAVARIDTEVEVAYFRNGGILPYMVRRMVAAN
jgi:aconitate hydratase